MEEESHPNAFSPYARSASELKEIIATERRGEPFVFWRTAGGHQQIMALGQIDRATIGRSASNDVVIGGDVEVSRTHAVIERLGGEWTIEDDGLSHNGTFIGGVRITRRRRLTDGDTMRLGRTLMEYRAPGQNSTMVTADSSELPTVDSLTETQHRELLALCRPYKQNQPFVTPATNQNIAAEVFLSVDAVKNHLRNLFARFEISHLPQNQKRARLVECAFQWGLISDRDL